MGDKSAGVAAAFDQGDDTAVQAARAREIAGRFLGNGVAAPEVELRSAI